MKVAIVTGGNGVLGAAICKGLAKTGIKVAVLGRNSDGVTKTTLEIQEAGGTAIGVVADVLDQEALETARDHVLDAWDRIDILVNVAGGNQKGATIMPDQTVFDLDLNDWDKVVDLNLKGTLLPTLVFGQAFAESKSGCIINISSMASQQAITRVAGYSAAKAGVDALTRWLAVEMASKYGDQIRVNAVAPGFFIGKQNKELLTNPDGSLTARGETIISQTPMKRFGEPEELCGIVNWLCSDEASFVTGTIIPVDGGFSAFSGV